LPLVLVSMELDTPSPGARGQDLVSALSCKFRLDSTSSCLRVEVFEDVVTPLSLAPPDHRAPDPMGGEPHQPAPAHPAPALQCPHQAPTPCALLPLPRLRSNKPARDGTGDRIKKDRKSAKTYNTEDSPVVTDLSTSSAVKRVCIGEQQKHTTPRIRWSSPTQLLVRLSKAYVFGEEGSKNRGSRDPKTGASFPLVSAVRFKKTANPAVPQNRSGQSGTAANRASPSRTAPPSGNKGMKS